MIRFLLALVCGLVGAWFGYEAVREIYFAIVLLGKPALELNLPDLLFRPIFTALAYTIVGSILFFLADFFIPGPTREEKRRLKRMMSDQRLEELRFNNRERLSSTRRLR